ncbi:uncharacterized protein LOC131890027 isoform X1 [Tigriopus californicus]|uniref:uncharacterized protein LOC131890027 isoform X1 n=1 Tax=Tigriopus californicus TaxID=6832 RepID=UPI0027DA86EA|nr:uncharacterized protein LOC131890027 isoform X1 [Tigriopus californicus]
MFKTKVLAKAVLQGFAFLHLIVLLTLILEPFGHVLALGVYAENGQICEDHMEMIQELEYEDQIICKVQMVRKCQDEIDLSEDMEDAETCHTMYKKECEIFYRPHMTKVKVKVCPNGVGKPEKLERSLDVQENNEVDFLPNSVVIDVRPAPKIENATSSSECVDGKREVCVKKYDTECHTKMIKHEMMEDHPKCHVKMVEKCSPGPGDSGCHKVPAMRCRIEPRKVTKAQPETKCERVVRELCRSEECEQAKAGSIRGDQCYFRSQVVNEIIPEEKCHFQPHRMCHQIRRRRRRKLSGFSRSIHKRSPVFDFGPRRPELPFLPRSSDTGRCVEEPVEKCEKHVPIPNQ